MSKRADAGRDDRTRLARLDSANGDMDNIFFPIQLTMTEFTTTPRFTYTLLKVLTIHTRSRLYRITMTGWVHCNECVYIFNATVVVLIVTSTGPIMM